MAFFKYLSISSLMLTLPNLMSTLVSASPYQQPLTGSYAQDLQLASTPNFSRVRQNDSLCDAGSAQWTGTVRVGKDRNLFYWYIESRIDPENAPLLIWMNGGPGSSSMFGTLFEVGPCNVKDDGTGTTRNEYSWTQTANVVFIDQPIGVGFSATNDSDLWAKDLLEAGIDFSRFLDVFVEEVFPELEERPIHVVGESFGGNYVPVYAAMLRRKLASAVLIDPFVDAPILVLGTYEHLCVPTPLVRNGRQFNATACEVMEKGYPECEKAAQLCDLTYDAVTCRLAWRNCQSIAAEFDQTVVPGGWDPYDDRRECTEPPLCGSQGVFQIEKYLNSAPVKSALGLPKDFKFEIINFDFNGRWSELPGMFVPTTREVARILDVKETPVLVMNGMNDIGIWEGMVKTLDMIQWSGQARFKTQSLKPWDLFDKNGSKIGEGTYKGYDRLAIVNFNEAGHMAPHDQPAAAAFVIKKWLEQQNMDNL